MCYFVIKHRFGSSSSNVYCDNMEKNTDAYVNIMQM